MAKPFISINVRFSDNRLGFVADKGGTSKVGSGSFSGRVAFVIYEMMWQTGATFPIQCVFQVTQHYLCETLSVLARTLGHSHSSNHELLGHSHSSSHELPIRLHSSQVGLVLPSTTPQCFPQGTLLSASYHCGGELVR